MSLPCRVCRVELKNDDIVVLDDFAILRHKRCYDFEKYGHLIDSVGKFESVHGEKKAGAITPLCYFTRNF
jgi:hypothetical protein